MYWCHELLCNLWWWPLNLLRSWLVCKLVWNLSWFHGLPGYTDLSLLNRLLGGWFSHLISYNWSVLLQIARNALYRSSSGRIRGCDDKAKEQSGGPRVHVVPSKLETLPEWLTRWPIPHFSGWVRFVWGINYQLVNNRFESPSFTG
jgi:hypothetical protein